ncbi:hypothetical protein KHQ88_06175 [Mycoplasmatota bacterium]|nr:hypothetical protein KHQ88_06175 [Mycoplasmatota bacterium]
MKFLNKKAITMVETLASIVILSFVFTVVLTLIISARVSTTRINERVIAVNVGKSIRDSIERHYTYNDIISEITTSDYMITIDNCTDLINGCDLFSYDVNDQVYDDEVTITFLQATTESQNYGIIDFVVTIVYYQSDEINIEGLIYE